MELSSSIYVSLLQAIYTLFAWTSCAAAHQERRNMWTENCLHGLKFYGTENPDFFCFPLLSCLQLCYDYHPGCASSSFLQLEEEK